MGFSQIKGKLTTRIGRPVAFSPPQDIHKRGGQGANGKIVDEVWAFPETNDEPARQAASNGDWGDYAFCSQLIEWDSGDRSVRLAYYRRRAGEDHWEYASQMTVCSDPATIKTLLERTLAKTAWFEEAGKEQEKATVVITEECPEPA